MSATKFVLYDPANLSFVGAPTLFFDSKEDAETYKERDVKYGNYQIVSFKPKA